MSDSTQVAKEGEKGEKGQKGKNEEKGEKQDLVEYSENAEYSKNAVDKKRVIISYQGELYDVTDFSHPGEGAGVYLSDYNGKEVDEEVDNSHMTDEPQCMLAQAREKDFYGIKYLGKSDKNTK